MTDLYIFSLVKVQVIKKFKRGARNKEIWQCKNPSWYSKTVVNAADRGKATKHSNQRQNVRVPTGVTYKGEPRMTIKSDSLRILSLRSKWVKVYLKPTSAHTHTEDRQHMAVALFKIYQGDFLNKPYISLQLCLFFFSIFAGWELRCCERVCALYKDYKTEKDAQLEVFVLFF